MPHSKKISPTERHQFAQVLNRVRHAGQLASNDMVVGRSSEVPFGKIGSTAFEQAQIARDLSCWCMHVEALQALALAFHLLDHPKDQHLRQLADLPELNRILTEAAEEVAVYSTAHFICHRADLLQSGVKKFSDEAILLATRFSVPCPI
jgi:hypothetical protein